MDYKLAVFIGRFQPFHKGHLQVIEHALNVADKVLVLVGSAGAAPSPKNPWSYDDRRRMIWDSLQTSDVARRVEIRPVRDYYYNEDTWLAQVQSIVAEVTHAVDDEICLVGSYKDGSSYYLKLFPQWDFSPAQTDPLNATDMRNALFEQVTNKLRSYDGTVVEQHRNAATGLIHQAADLPWGTKTYLKWWISTKDYGDIASEYHYVKDYKAQWADSPYPPTFVTTDAVVTCSGHVLVVKRKLNPGKGLYALPGGFLRSDQFVVDSMLRELREETGIKVAKLILRSNIVADKVFDHPDRSLRGRTISHGYHIKLLDGSLPEVTAHDDAAEVMWMPLWDVTVNESKFFEDHAHIINYFTTLGAQGGR